MCLCLCCHWFRRRDRHFLLGSVLLLVQPLQKPRQKRTPNKVSISWHCRFGLIKSYVSAFAVCHCERKKKTKKKRKNISFNLFVMLIRKEKKNDSEVVWHNGSIRFVFKHIFQFIIIETEEFNITSSKETVQSFQANHEKMIWPESDSFILIIVRTINRLCLECDMTFEFWVLSWLKCIASYCSAWNTMKSVKISSK